MGNVEKWVVLGVLALIVGILVVSLNVDDPLKKDKVVLAGSSDKPAVAASEPSKPATAKAETPKSEGLPPTAQAPGSALLSTSVDTSAATAHPMQTNGLPSGSILKTIDGLQESYMTDAMFYTWKTGDTFPGLAQRFYGDPSRLAILKRINEGRTEVQPGERVLIPLYDLDAVQAPSVGLATPATKPGSSTGARIDAPKKTEIAPAALATSTSGPRVHIVKDGESLWKIAKQELGSGARWNEIYTANRDVLASPEALHTGQKLRVP